MLTIYRNITALRRSERTTLFLAEASATLFSSSLDYAATLQSLADLAVPALADWCAVVVLDPDGGRDMVAVANAPPEKAPLVEELARDYTSGAHNEAGLHKVIRTGVADFFPRITDERLVATTRTSATCGSCAPCPSAPCSPCRSPPGAGRSASSRGSAPPGAPSLHRQDLALARSWPAAPPWRWTTPGSSSAPSPPST